MELNDRFNHVGSREVRTMSHCTIAISRAMSGDYVGHNVNEIFWRWKIMRLNSKLAMNMTENTRLYKHAIMYKKICINMLTQKDELAVAKTHHDIESLNLRPFSTIDEQSSRKMVSIKTYGEIQWMGLQQLAGRDYVLSIEYSSKLLNQVSKVREILIPRN